MSLSRRCRKAVIVGVGVLSVCTPAGRAGAQVLPTVPVAPGSSAGGSASSGSCTHDRHVSAPAGVAGDGQARTGGNEEAQCQLGGVQTIAAGVGQQSSVVGANVTTSVVNAPIQTSAGSAAAAGPA